MFIKTQLRKYATEWIEGQHHGTVHFAQFPQTRRRELDVEREPAGAQRLDTAVVAENGPFGAAATHHPVLCALDRGLIAGMLEGLGAARPAVTHTRRARGDTSGPRNLPTSGCRSGRVQFRLSIVIFGDISALWSPVESEA